MCECQKVVFTDVILVHLRPDDWMCLLQSSTASYVTTDAVKNQGCYSDRLATGPTHVQLLLLGILSSTLDQQNPTPAETTHCLVLQSLSVTMCLSCSESSLSTCIKTSYKVRRRSRDEAEWRRARLYISTEQPDWVQPLRRVTSVTWRLVTIRQTLAIEEVTPNTVVMSDRAEVEGRWLGRDVHTPFRGPRSHPRPGAGQGWPDGQVWILG